MSDPIPAVTVTLKVRYGPGMVVQHEEMGLVAVKAFCESVGLTSEALAPAIYRLRGATHVADRAASALMTRLADALRAVEEAEIGPPPSVVVPERDIIT